MHHHLGSCSSDNLGSIRSIDIVKVINMLPVFKIGEWTRGTKGTKTKGGSKSLLHIIISIQAIIIVTIIVIDAWFCIFLIGYIYIQIVIRNWLLIKNLKWVTPYLGLWESWQSEGHRQ